MLDQHADWHVTVGAGRSCETPAPAKAGGAVLVNPGSHWRQYARVKLTFDGPTLTDQVADVVPVSVGADAPKPEPQAAALVAGWKKKLDDAFGQQIGYTATGFDQTAAATGTWLAKALKEHTKADVGLFNRHSIRASLPKGAITLASVYDLTPFENRVVVAKVPGELLKKELANPEAVFFGVTLAGLNPKKTYSVATHNFVFFGGDGFGLQKSSTSSTFTGEAWQTAVIEWTKKQGSSAKKPLEATWGR